MILSGNKWLRSKNGKGLFRMLRGLWVPGPPEASLSPGSSFNEGEEMTPASCYSQGFLFCFKLQSLLRQSIILLSGEQTQQLKGRARQVLRAEVPGTAPTASCPKGTFNPLQASCTLSQNPHPPPPPPTSAAVSLVAERWWWSLPRLAAPVSFISALSQAPCAVTEEYSSAG